MMTHRLSEDALALAFAAAHADHVRYAKRASTMVDWYIFTDDEGCKPDPTLYVLHFVREICRAAAAQHDSPELASAAMISAVERLARCDQRLAALPADLGPPEKRPARRASSKGRAQP